MYYKTKDGCLINLSEYKIYRDGNRIVFEAYHNKTDEFYCGYATEAEAILEFLKINDMLLPPPVEKPKAVMDYLNKLDADVTGKMRRVGPEADKPKMPNPPPNEEPMPEDSGNHEMYPVIWLLVVLCVLGMISLSYYGGR